LSEPRDFAKDAEHSPGPTARSAQRADVLLVAPLPAPPLLGGIETGVALQLESNLSKTVATRLFNTTREKDPNRRLWERLLYQTSSCLKFLLMVIRLRPKIVHVKTASGINFYQNAAYVLLARLMGRQVLLQLHAGDFPSFYNGAGVFGRAAIRLSLQLPHGLIALSRGWAQYFQSISKPAHVAIIPNATRTLQFATARPDRPRFGVPSNRIALLFMGTRSPKMNTEKGLPELVQAVNRVRRRHPELLLVVAGRSSHADFLLEGPGPEGEGWINVGEVSATDKPALFRSVDLFALPSQFENMPNSVLEAMAAGLPVIATNVGALPEMLENERSGFLVSVGDVASLSQRILELVEDVDLRGRLGAAAAEVARREFDFSLLEERLLQEYCRVAPTLVADSLGKPLQTRC
jgi:glycosyltransferase involved in cell wall biosynthesis